MKSTELRRILVPIDFSLVSEKDAALREEFRRALWRQAASRARGHAADNFSAAADGAAVRLFGKRNRDQSAQTHAEVGLGIIDRAGGESACMVRSGAPAEEITRAARETNADLIAIGTRGYTGLKHAFLGSTTARVVRNAPCPVLVVRDRENFSASQRARCGRTSLQFQKILVPLDFSECSRLGLDYALGFAREFRSSLVLFHSVVVQSYPLSDEYTALEGPNILGLQQEDAEKEMKALRDDLAESNLKITSKITVGPLIDQLNDYVGANAVDLIITSTHGRSGLRRVFIGSTAEQIVRHAPCPVLVVPNRAAGKDSPKGRR